MWNPEWTSFDTAGNKCYISCPVLSLWYGSTGTHRYFIAGGELFAQFFPNMFGELVVWEETALSRSPNGGSLAVRELVSK